MIYVKDIFTVMFKHRNIIPYYKHITNSFYNNVKLRNIINFIINLIVEIMIHKFNDYKSMAYLNISWIVLQQTIPRKSLIKWTEFVFV